MFSTVEIPNKNQEVEQPKELSYEELKNVAAQLQHQNEQMRNAIMKLDYTNTFKRLDYLFKVIEFSIQFPDDFITNCINEIVDMMTVKEEEKEDKES